MSEGCCCSGGRSCCFPDPERRRIEIDFLYLDLSACTRCVGADASLDAAIADVSTVLKAAGFDVVVNKVNITSKELALNLPRLESRDFCFIDRCHCWPYTVSTGLTSDSSCRTD